MSVYFMIFILKSCFLLKNTEGSFDVGFLISDFGKYGNVYRFGNFKSFRNVVERDLTKHKFHYWIGKIVGRRDAMHRVSTLVLYKFQMHYASYF